MTDKHTPETPHLSATCSVCGTTGYAANSPCPLHVAGPKLLEALEEWSLPYIDYVGFIDSDIAKRLKRTRAAIEAAKP